MGWGAGHKESVVIASGASTSSYIVIDRSFERLGLTVSTMSTQAAIKVQYSPDNGTTWFNSFHPPINSSTVGINPLVIASALGAAGATVLPIGMVKGAYRFVASDVVSGGVVFNCIFGD